MCFYNLEQKQREFLKHYPGFQLMPVFFFTQLLALALGVKPNALGFERHFADPMPLLREKQLV
jgi:heterodisulfide reductase subunit B